jgi:hypothetical protein
MHKMSTYQRPAAKKSRLKQTLLFAGLLLGSPASFAQVGISTTTITPDASSVLELRSTTTGFLPPRMTTTQRNAITTPANGLIIYNTTTSQLNSYNGSTWVVVGGTGSGSVTTLSVATANGFEGTVTDPTTTPEITISTDVSGMLMGDGTGMSAATSGSDYSEGTASLGTGILKSTTGTGNLTIAVAADFPTLNQNTTGSAATVTTNANLTGPVTSVGNATSIAANVVTNSNLSQVATQTFKGRTTAGTGDVQDLTVAQAKTMLNLTGTNSGDQTITLTGDVGGAGTGSFATTIANNVVSNAKLAQVATQTFKGRTTAGTGNAEDLTISQAKALLNLTGTNSGDQTITLTGDVTGSGTGSFASAIAANAVTYAKIQNVSATNRVLGRSTAGAGLVEEIATTGSGSVVRSTSPTITTPVGIVKGDVGLGNVDNTSDAGKPISTATQTALDLKVNISDKGINNGVASLDAGGKIPTSQLPTGALIYKGTWNATTNTPTLSDGTGSNGWLYKVSTAGTINLGSGSIVFAVGDEAIHNGTVWQKAPNNASVSSVNSLTGAVTLNTSNVSEVTNLYYTDTRARAAVSATAPLAYSSGTGVFSLPKATNAVNGYLSAIDWADFDQKQDAGNYITALTGDVTAAGPGSSAATIASNAVTYGKMQTMTTNKLLGSGASGTAVGEITLGTGLSFTGTTLNAALSSGTVTNVSIATANGFSGSVSNASTTPAITITTPIAGILVGNGTSVAAAVPSDFPTLNQSTSGNAATVTTNANLTGPVTSVGNATSITANAVTNAMTAQVATQTFKGRTTAATGNVEDLTATQATAMLNTVTSVAKGLAPASGGGTSTFLRADGTWAAPPGGGMTIVTLAADVINNNATLNTIADVTGLSFAVTAGVTYRFRAIVYYTSAATTTGSRWSINGPASPTLLAYQSTYALTATTNTSNNAVAYNIPAACNASSASTTGNIAQIEGIIKPSASGTVIVRFASEVASSAITARAGSTLTWW